MFAKYDREKNKFSLKYMKVAAVKTSSWYAYNRRINCNNNYNNNNVNCPLCSITLPLRIESNSQELGIQTGSCTFRPLYTLQDKLASGLRRTAEQRGTYYIPARNRTTVVRLGAVTLLDGIKLLPIMIYYFYLKTIVFY